MNSWWQAVFEVKRQSSESSTKFQSPSTSEGRGNFGLSLRFSQSLFHISFWSLILFGAYMLRTVSVSPLCHGNEFIRAQPGMRSKVWTCSRSIKFLSSRKATPGVEDGFWDERSKLSWTSFGKGVGIELGPYCQNVSPEGLSDGYASMFEDSVRSWEC